MKSRFICSSNLKILVPVILTLALAALFFGYKHPLARTFYPDSVSYIKNEIYRPFLYPMYLDVMTLGKAQSALQLSYSEMERVFSGAVLVQRALVVCGYLAIFWALSSMLWFLPILCLSTIVFCERILHLAIFGEYFTYASCILSEGLIYPWILFSIPLLIVNLKNLKIKNLTFLGIWFYLAVAINPRMIIFGIATIIPMLAIFGKIWFEKSKFPKLVVFKGLIPLITFISLILFHCGYNLAKYGVFSPSPISGLASISMAIQFARPEDAVTSTEPKSVEIMNQIFKNPRYMPHENEAFVNFNIALFTHAYRDAVGNELDDYIEMNRFATSIVKSYMAENPAAQRRWFTWFTQYIVPQYFNSRSGVIAMSLMASFFSFFMLFQHGKMLFSIPAVLPFVSLANILLSLGMQGFEPRYTKTGELWLYVLPALLLGLLAKEFPQNFQILANRIANLAPLKYRHLLQLKVS